MTCNVKLDVITCMQCVLWILKDKDNTKSFENVVIKM